MAQGERELAPQRSPHDRWGYKLRALRRGRGFSLAELGRKVFYNASHLAKFERGERVPPLHVVEACDRELDARGELIDLYWLIDPANVDGYDHGGSVVHGAGRVPAQLPADIGTFVGRRAELAQLDAVLAKAGGKHAAVVISAVSGTAGVGKTSLAVHWAHQIAGRYPDGQLYVNLQGFDPAGRLMSPGDALHRFLEAFGVHPERIPGELYARSALYRSLLANKRVLVVLDNARDAEQVRPLLPGATGCLVVVTSRNRLCGLVARESAAPLCLDLLGVDEAREFLASRVGEDRVNAEPQAVAAIIELCARLPLALSVVAARAALRPHVPLATLVLELGKARGRLDVLSTDEGDIDVRSVFDCSMHSVSADAARLFRLFGLHPGPDISVAAAASLAEIPESQTRRLLSELSSAYLVAEHSDGRYGFHDLLRAYAAELAQSQESDAERHQATVRMLDHYLGTAQTAAKVARGEYCEDMVMIRPQAGVVPENILDHAQAWKWFQAEKQVLQAVLDVAAELGFDLCVWQLATAMHGFFDSSGCWHELEAICETAVRAARQLRDHAVLHGAYGLLAQNYIRLCRYAEARAHYQLADELAAEYNDQRWHASILLGIAWLYERLDRPTESLDYAIQALDHWRAVGDPQNPEGLHKVGWYYALVGNYQLAMEYCQQALARQEEVGHPYGRAGTLRSLGYVRHSLGHYQRAIACYLQALATFRDVGDCYYEAEVHYRLGDTYQAAGDLEQAHTSWRAAIKILDDRDHPDADLIRARLRSTRAAWTWTLAPANETDSAVKRAV